MGNKKDSIMSEIDQNFSSFAKNTIFYNDILEVIQDSKEPADLNEAVGLLERCMASYFDILEDTLNENDFSIIHNAALHLISVNDEIYTPRTYTEMFEDIQDALHDGKETGFLNFRDAEAIRLLNVLSDDYRLILFKLFILEPYVKRKMYYSFADLLARYTALIAFDASQCAAFYNSNEYKDLIHKLLSVECGETSQPDEVIEKRKALIEEITTEAIKIIDADDSMALDERTKNIPKIVDDLAESVNKRTEAEINIALEKEFPQWKTEVESRKKRHSKRETRIAELKISSRRARRLVREAWEKQHATNIEN